MIEKLKRRRTYWGCAFLWVLLIYSTLYIVRPVTNYLKEVTPFSLTVNAFLIIVLVGLIINLCRSIKIRKLLSYVLLCFTFFIYGFLILILERPEERIHLFQYGVLAFLIYRALRIDLTMLISLILGFVLTSLLGWGDEGIQNLLPNRYYETKDVMLNCVSGALGLLLTFIFEREMLE